MRRVIVLLAVSASLAFVGVPVEADSSELVTGALAFEGPVDLSAGTWSGTLTGELSGSYREANGNRIPWTVAMINPGTATMSSVEILGCAAGTVTGRIRTKTNDFGQVYGLWFFSVTNLIPRYIVAVDATFDFVWHRAASAGPLVVTGAVVDVQLYTAEWHDDGFDSTAGWVRVVDTEHVAGQGGAARIDSDDPTTCDEGVLKGDLGQLAVRAG